MKRQKEDNIKTKSLISVTNIRNIMNTNKRRKF